MIRFSRKQLRIPYLVFLLVFVVLPLLVILYYALTNGEGQFTWENFREFFVDGKTMGTLFYSLMIAVTTTIVCLLIAYPTAYILARGNLKRGPVYVILLIFVLLWMSFSSLRSSLIVMINVPLALIGGVLGLLATDQLLSVPAAVGFIALFGIAMQDAVVMVTDFRELRRSGTPLREAVLHGSAVRFRAVILTTLTTLLGLLPLLLSTGIGAEVQRPLAAIVVFGLGTSTLLTLFFLPVLYYEVEKRFETLPR